MWENCQMEFNEALASAAKLAPRYPITVTKLKEQCYRAVPDDFPYMASIGGTPADAKSYAFHQVLTTLACRIQKGPLGLEIPPVLPEAV